MTDFFSFSFEVQIWLSTCYGGFSETILLLMKNIYMENLKR